MRPDTYKDDRILTPYARSKRVFESSYLSPSSFNRKFIEQCALLISGFIIIMFAAGSIPNRAHAFWPFFTNAAAAINTPIPDSKTSVLVAATNFDPNPDKGFSDTQTTSDNALLAYGGPGGTTADVVHIPPPDRISVYAVRTGDTLSEIADMFGVSVHTIVWANNLKGIYDIHPGDILVILPVSGVERTVVNGDTLKSLAKRYSANADEIAQYNGLNPGDNLVVGSTIIIPGGEIAAPVPIIVRSSGSSSIRKEPYLGGSGPAQIGYYSNPMPGGIITQGIHGWNAVDIGAARGTPIHAAAAGTVIVARNNGAWNGGYGNYVVVTHDNGTQTLYAHMKNTIVSPGQSVSSGEVIGYEGTTGLATGPHLHFEVRGAKNPFHNCAVGSVCSPE